MDSEKRQWLTRILLGALAGVAAHLLLGLLLGSFSLLGPSSGGFRFPDCGFSGWNSSLEWLGVLLSFALFALFGAEVGVATLPFAGGGRELALRSLAHFLLMCATAAVWAGLNTVHHPMDYLYFLIPLALIYGLVWLGRWVGWYAEAAQIREKLGLAPAPSPLRWRESLPHLGFAAVLCLILPTVLGLCAARDVPVLTGMLYPWLLLPIGSFSAGVSLGRRQGLCPLYPLACALFCLLFGLLSRLWCSINFSSLPWEALLFALAGDLLGAGIRWKKERRAAL